MQTTPINGKITVQCYTCNNKFTIEFSEEQWREWKNGELFQNALPNLSPSERELLISRICGECWDILFKDESDEIDEIQ